MFQDCSLTRLFHVLCCSVLLAACAGDDLPAGGIGGDSDASVEPPDGSACATPKDGCPCSTQGATLDCSNVLRKSAEYVQCSKGTRTCNGSTWSACVSNDPAERSVSTLALKPQSLGSSSDCESNPCDPYCQRFVDDSTGLDAGADSGLNITDGISLVQQIGTVGHPVCTGLTIDPGPQTLTVTTVSPVTPSQLTFTARLTPADCYSGAVPALWTLDRFDIATISSSGVLTLVTPIAGQIHLDAYVGAFHASTTATIVVNAIDVSAAPSGYTASTFNGTTNSDTATFLYPYAGTVFPLGLPSPLLQWAAGSNGTANAVKVTLRYPASSPIFTWSAIQAENQTAPTPTLPGQPRATIPQNVWFAFEQTAKGNDAVFAIQRYAASKLRVEISRTIHFATDQLKGTVYYNSYGTNLVKNYQYTVGGARFGAATLGIGPGATSPSLVAGSDSTGTTGTGCRVCHSVASQGGLLVTNRFNPSDYLGTTYNLTTTPASETFFSTNNDGRYSWPALSPDGTVLFSNAGPPRAVSGTDTGLQGSDNSVLTSKLYSVPSGSALTTVNLPTTLKAATPVFASDGRSLAFNFYGGTASPLGNSSSVTSGNKRSLASMSFEPSTRTFSNFRVLHTPGTYTSGSTTYNTTAVWPSFLPSGQNGIVFERELLSNGRDFGGTRSTCDASGTCADSGTRAELWWVSTGTTPTATKLTNLNGVSLPTNSSGHTADAELNYEPTVNPQLSGGYSWVVYTSRRLYGNVATINPYYSDPRYKDISVQPTPKKLWVAAIDQNPTSGTDPSHPAFYLPGQELLAGNSRGYWVLQTCRAASTTLSAANACDSDLDCCNAPASAVCRLDPPPLTNPPTRHCVPVVANACIADGQACTDSASCCNFGSGSTCTSGVCQPPPPSIIYNPATFTRDYEAVCPAGRGVLWRFFEWQTKTPTGTSITFSGQSADTSVGLAAATAVSLGTSAPPPTATTTWTSATQTVDEILKANGQVSHRFLRVSATLLPATSPSATPVLDSWRVSYSCPFIE